MATKNLINNNAAGFLWFGVGNTEFICKKKGAQRHMFAGPLLYSPLIIHIPRSLFVTLRLGTPKWNENRNVPSSRGNVTFQLKTTKRNVNSLKC